MNKPLLTILLFLTACTATRQTFVATESRSSVVAARDSAKWVCADESAVRKYFIEYGRDTLHFVVIDSVLPGKHTYAYPLPDTAGYVRIHAVGLADSYTKSIFYTKNKVTITSALYSSTVLKWTVNNEKNVTGYLIEKTSDNRTWSKTTQIPDRGNGTYNYRYSKTKVKYQYRLTPVFLDASKGTATIFK